MRKHISPALVISVIALFVALGGSSYAALKLPKNSVGEKQIRKSAVTSVKVKDGSLLATDFRNGQLPRGEKGEPGATGATGARGPSDGYVGSRQTIPMQPLDTVALPVVVSPQLPAGNYIAMARTNIAGFGVASGIACSFGDDSVGSLATNAGSLIPLSLVSGFRLTEPGRITMFCQLGSGSGASVKEASISAIRVESLAIETTGN